MWFFLALKIVAIVFAAIRSLQGRFAVGVVAVAGLIYLTAARGLSLIPPHVKLPLSGVLGASWWIYPTAITTLSVAATAVAFRVAGREREGTPKHKHLEGAALAFLGNSLLDVALLVIVALGHLLVATDDF